MGAKRLTRKEIVREDPFHVAMRQTYDTLLFHKSHILIGIVALAAIIGGVSLWVYYSSRTDAELQNLFSKALETYHGTVQQPPAEAASAPHPSQSQFKSDAEKYNGALKQFNDIANKYPSRQLGLYAKYYAALCQQKLGHTDEAIKTLETIKGKGDARAAALIKNALAQLYEAKGNYSNVIQLDNELLNEDTGSFPKDQVLMSLGKAYESAQNKSEAIKVYERLVREYPTSTYIGDANTRLNRLGVKSPGPSDPRSIPPLSLQ